MGEDSLIILPIFELGPVQLTTTVFTTWVVIAIIGCFAWLATRRLQMSPGRIQTLIEAIVSVIEESVRDIAPQHFHQIMPFIGSLWVFLVIANLIWTHTGYAFTHTGSVSHCGHRFPGFPVSTLVWNSYTGIKKTTCYII